MKRVAGVAATVAAVACAFVEAAAFAVGASALELVVSVHWPAFAEGAGGPGLVWSGVSDALLPGGFGACPVAAEISGLS